MKTNINKIQQDFNLPHRIINQISNCPETGFLRVIGFTGEGFNDLEQRWYIYAEMIWINPTTNKIFRREPAKSKNKEWLISNDYLVLLTDSNGNPLQNPDFQPTEEIQVAIGTNEETGEPIYETQTIEKEITYENSPFKLMPAFDRYSEFKIQRDNPVSLPQIWDAAVSSDDAMGYFDDKEVHLDVLDVVKSIYSTHTQRKTTTK